MMLTYALEHRHRYFVLAFAVGCALSTSYGFLSGAWPFGVVESLWCGIAPSRFRAGLSYSAHELVTIEEAIHSILARSEMPEVPFCMMRLGRVTGIKNARSVS
ncbi:MAG: hypothetical protein ACYDBS_10925 [Acidimicrobiales bacterium]